MKTQKTGYTDTHAAAGLAGIKGASLWLRIPFEL
jgi:hypothetical protein